MRIRSLQIDVPIEEIRAFCKRNHIHSFALFGSVLRDDFSEGSDIDVLVKFEPGHVPGFRFFAMQGELSEIFGRKVDLNTVGFLSPHIRSEVREEAVIYYAET
jgi:hypothetical protein